LGYDSASEGFMVLEAVILQVKMVLKVILKSLSKASPIIASMNGYLSHELTDVLKLKVNMYYSLGGKV